MSDYFNVADIAGQIEEHIAYRGNTDAISLLWRGHLAALFYGESLDFDEFFELLALLKPVGREELRELYSKFVDINELPSGTSQLFDALTGLVINEAADDPEVRDPIVALFEHVFGPSQSKT